MLEYILRLTNDIISNTNSLSNRDKANVYDKVNYALNQTRTHIRNTRKGNIDQSSSQLSNIWQRTGRELRLINNPEIRNFANTINQKSKYWSDPIGFDLKYLDIYDMRLTEVENNLKTICL